MWKYLSIALCHKYSVRAVILSMTKIVCIYLCLLDVFVVWCLVCAALCHSISATRNFSTIDQMCANRNFYSHITNRAQYVAT